MLREFIHAPFDDAHRGDDRRTAGPGAPPVLGPGTKPPVMRRRTIALIALVGIAAILYGTAAPFQIDPGRSLTWHLNWQLPAAGDALANFVIYVPIGAFLRLVLRRRGSRPIAEYALSLLLLSALSYLTEVIQTVISARVPCWSDVMCNVIGAVVGIILAPRVQRWLRNLHAYLYVMLRCRPFAVGAAATLACVFVFALAPPDIYPSPGHVAKALERFQWSPLEWFSLSGWTDGQEFGPAQVLDKLLAAGSYGLLALALLLAQREATLSPGRSAWHAFSRSVLVVLVIETIQLFTISHAADGRDLSLGWICCGIGAVIGYGLVCRYPKIHQQPVPVLRSLVAVVASVLILWVLASTLLARPHEALVDISWIPMLDNFHLQWNDLLGQYITGLLRYGLVSGLLVLRCRARRQAPSAGLVIGGVLAIAVLAAAAAVFRHHGFDASQFLLAVLASMGIVRLDRAVFGRRPRTPTPAAGPEAPPAVAEPDGVVVGYAPAQGWEGRS